MSSTAEPDRLRAEVRAFLEASGVRPGTAIVCACSGGPDSTALLAELVALSGELGLQVACAYLDHGIRSAGERERERGAVSDLARRMGVPLVSSALEPGLLARASRRLGRSLEQLARDARYRFLEEVRVGRDADFIAVGHTADDTIETVLMRVCQGVDISGLGGIPERRGRIIRPFSHVFREDVLRYLETRGLGYVVDASNASPQYLRNRVRAELIPAVARVFPSYRRSILELARKVRATQRFVERAAARRIRWKQAGDGLEAPWRAFAGADAALRMASVYTALDRLGASRIPYRFLEPLRRPLDAEKGGILVAGCGFRVERRGDRVRAEPDVVRRRKIGYLVHVRAAGQYAIPEWGIVVEAASSDPGAFRAGVSDGEALVVRSPRAGDRVRRRDAWVGIDRLAARCPGGSGAAALLPIVANRSGVLGVLGSAVGCAELPEDHSWAAVPGRPAISVAVRVEEQ